MPVMIYIKQGFYMTDACVNINFQFYFFYFQRTWKCNIIVAITLTKAIPHSPLLDSFDNNCNSTTIVKVYHTVNLDRTATLSVVTAEVNIVDRLAQNTSTTYPM